jgi:DnaD/phage-associated family protein
LARFRMIHTEFWDDPRVSEEMTPEDKYFFLYLLTNSNTTQIGIYQITKKQMAFDMGYSIESINSLLERFINHHKIVIYNPETRELAIKNWGKYNFNKGGKPVLDCVKSELNSVKDKSLISFVSERILKDEIKKVYDSYTTRGRIVEEDNKKTQTPSTQGFHDTSTTGGQEEEEEEEKQKQKEKEKQEKEEEEKSRDVATDFYQQNFGILSPFIGECIVKWEEDLGYEIVIEAMKRALKQQKKWSYAESILRDWANNNAKSLADIQALDKEFERRKGVDNGQKVQQHSRGNETLGGESKDSITGGQVGWIGRKKVSVSEVPGQDGLY